MPIIVSGSLVYDYIMNFPDSFRNHILPDQLHILSVSFIVDKLVRGYGGTAGNIGYTIKLLGGEPFVVSALGMDDEPYIEHFQENHIATEHIVRDPAKMTASAHITTDVDDNQITAFYPGALKDAASVHLDSLHGNIAIISPTDKQVMIQHLNEAADAGKLVIFDPGQQIGAFDGLELIKLISRADIVIGNDYEMKVISEKTKRGVIDFIKDDTTVITTLGNRGSTISMPDGKTIDINACTVQSVDDPTGAGDAYRAGLAIGLVKDLDISTCAKMGSVAAAYAIEKYGTQNHHFTKIEFVERYKQNYGEYVEL